MMEFYDEREEAAQILLAFARFGTTGLKTCRTLLPTLIIREQIASFVVDGVALLRRVVEHFPSGELCFDVCNWLGISLQKINPVVRRSGSTLHWAVNEPNDILNAVAGVRLLAAISVFETDAFKGHRRRRARLD